MSATDYSAGFYEAIAPGCRLSAAAVVPLICERHQPKRVLDVGCGQGWWSLEFAERGCEVVSVDGEWVPEPMVEVQHISPTDLPTGFDLAVCLEVAEHLPESAAVDLVRSLARAAEVVVFSAAIPGQTGAGHVNCQWPSWWADLFRAEGLKPDDSIRRKIWALPDVEPWYRQNLLTFHRSGRLAGPLDVVHPDIWAWKL